MRKRAHENQQGKKKPSIGQRKYRNTEKKIQLAKHMNRCSTLFT